MTKKRYRPGGLNLKEAFGWHMPGGPPEEGCWEWKGPAGSRRYGLLPFGGKLIGAHRASYEVHFGAIPPGMHVLHDPALCNNPPCVNPNHLRLGTHKENQEDKQVAGTQANGEKNGSAKLTEELVRAIRAEYAAGGVSQYKLASKYGITQSVVSCIVRNRYWKHVE